MEFRGRLKQGETLADIQAGLENLSDVEQLLYFSCLNFKTFVFHYFLESYYYLNVIF